MIGILTKLKNSFGCPRFPLTFRDQYEYNPQFLEEIGIARNEFVKWVQDKSPDGVHLPPYKELNDKAKQLWNEYVKSPNYR